MKNENKEKTLAYVFMRIKGKTTKRKGFLSKFRKAKVHDMTAKKEELK